MPWVLVEDKLVKIRGLKCACQTPKRTQFENAHNCAVSYAHNKLTDIELKCLSDTKRTQFKPDFAPRFWPKNECIGVFALKIRARKQGEYAKRTQFQNTQTVQLRSKCVHNKLTNIELMCLSGTKTNNGISGSCGVIRFFWIGIR